MAPHEGRRPLRARQEAWGKFWRAVLLDVIGEAESEARSAHSLAAGEPIATTEDSLDDRPLVQHTTLRPAAPRPAA
jgi:hypothetical protein